MPASLLDQNDALHQSCFAKFYSIDLCILNEPQFNHVASLNDLLSEVGEACSHHVEEEVELSVFGRIVASPYLDNGIQCSKNG